MSPEFVRAGSLRDVLQYASRPGAALLAGGTDLVVKMRKGVAHPSCLIDIAQLPDLLHVRVEDGGIAIGAAVRVANLLDHSYVQSHLPVLGHAIDSLGCPQIRNRATLGGNLSNASPAADTAIPLLLYEARLSLCSTNEERTMDMPDLFTGPGKTSLNAGELITEVFIPTTTRWDGAIFHKVGKRKAMTIAIASLGALLRLDDGAVGDIRLAAGSVASTPMRLTGTESVMSGKSLTPSLIEEARHTAMSEVQPIDDVRGSASYRRRVVGDLLASFLAQQSHA